MCVWKKELSITTNKVEQTVEQATDTTEYHKESKETASKDFVQTEVGKEVWDDRDNKKFEGERYYKTQSENQKQKQRKL